MKGNDTAVVDPKALTEEEGVVEREALSVTLYRQRLPPFLAN